MGTLVLTEFQVSAEGMMTTVIQQFTNTTVIIVSGEDSAIGDKISEQKCGERQNIYIIS